MRSTCSAHAAPKTTWNYIVDANLPLNKRACVLCGGMNMKHRRSVNTSMLMKKIGNSKDSVAHVTKAILSKKIQKLSLFPTQFDDIWCTCASCYYWTFRSRSKKPRLPLQSFLWYMRTLDEKYKRFTDARVLHRIACVLTDKDPQNYYSCALFTQEELQCIQNLSMAGTDKVHAIIADFYWQQNAQPLFVKQSSTAENLRKFAKMTAKDNQAVNAINIADNIDINQIDINDMDVEDIEEIEDIEDIEDITDVDTSNITDISDISNIRSITDIVEIDSMQVTPDSLSHN